MTDTGLVPQVEAQTQRDDGCKKSERYMTSGRKGRGKLCERKSAKAYKRRGSVGGQQVETPALPAPS